MTTFANVLDVFRRVFPPALIGADAVQRLTTTVGDIPDALGAGYILECRLTDDPHVDLGIVIDPTITQGRSLLASNDLPSRLHADPVWQRVTSFSHHWNDSTQPLHTDISTIWLEFDMDGAAPSQPSFFLGPSPDAWQRTSTDAPTNPHAFDWLIDTLRLLDPNLTDADNLRRCLASVPSSAEVFQLGLMLSRGKHDVRLCVRGKPDAALFDYLPQLGWSGDASQLRGLLATLSGLVDNIALDVDVSTTLGNRIGIECRFDQWRQPSQEPRWQSFLDYLLSVNLCTPAKRDALLAWPTFSYHRFPSDRLPRVLIRALNHIKIVVEQGKPLEAKAYLWFGSRSADYMKARQEERKGGT